MVDPPHAAAEIIHSTSFLSPSSEPDGVPNGVIILNYPIRSYTDGPGGNPLLEALLKGCTPGLFLCADGGGGRLYAYDAPRRDAELPASVPDAIIGDLDSLSDDVRSYYEGRRTAHGGRCAVLRDRCQDSNDLTKALAEMGRRMAALCDGTGTAGRVSVYGAFGGRLDQMAAALNALHRWPGTGGPPASLRLFSDDCSAVLLRPGVTNVVRLHAPWEDGGSCGLLPLGGACSVVTTGLRWDLDGTVPLAFGGLVSSSNAVKENQSGYVDVIVETDAPLVWTVSLRETQFSGTRV